MRQYLKVLGWNAHVLWLCVRTNTLCVHISKGLPKSGLYTWPVYAWNPIVRAVYIPWVTDSLSYMVCLHELGHAAHRHGPSGYLHFHYNALVRELVIAREHQAWMWAEAHYWGDRHKFLRLSRVALNTWTRK